ncbi:di-trans,poly-cis-decaprenylcistransferase [Candidatus Woesearchaeota archaeon]|nr:di-trans,poly-cis-decaprenylcistransferase [Candidatus Woesearchaeota archaeon]
MTQKQFDIRHIAIIMDGNRRWAKNNGLHLFEGHKKGAETLRDILEAGLKLGIKEITVYALSSENLKKRPKEELAYHFGLHKRYLKKEILDSDRFVRDKIKFNVFGRIDKLPADEQELLKQAIEKTKEFSNFYFNVCLAYNGQDEITDAVKELIRKGMNPEEITRESIKQHLYTKNTPAPELIIRTGMNPEQRLSGFLLWDSSYSEFHFTKTLWPDFSEQELVEILEKFTKRDRRMGK